MRSRNRPARSHILHRALRSLLAATVGYLLSMPFRVAAAEGLDAAPQSFVGTQNIRVPRLGRVRIYFPTRSAAAESPVFSGVRLERVRARIPGSTQRVSVSHSQSRLESARPELVHHELLFNARNPRTGRVSFIRMTQSSEQSADQSAPRALRIAAVPSTILSAITCGSEPRTSFLSQHQHGTSRDRAHRAAAIISTVTPTVRVAFVADALYNRRFGLRTEQHVATLIDQVNVIYERDLGLSLTPVVLARERVNPSALKSTDSSGLLDGFAVLAGRARYGEANVYHLLTGKDLSDNIIGLANLPGACAPSRSTRVGLSQYLNSAVDYMTIAHEIGHNLSAEHDTATQPSTLMYPSLPVDDVEFSATSRAQISAFRSFSDIRACFNAALPARSSVSLKATTDLNGSTSLTIGLPTDNDSCSVVLEGSTTTNFSASTKVTLTSNESFVLKVFSTINRRPNRNRKIYVRATATCGSSVTAAMTTVSPSSLPRTLPITSASAWANRFVESFK